MTAKPHYKVGVKVFPRCAAMHVAREQTWLAKFARQHFMNIVSGCANIGLIALIGDAVSRHKFSKFFLAFA